MPQNVLGDNFGPVRQNTTPPVTAHATPMASITPLASQCGGTEGAEPI